MRKMALHMVNKLAQHDSRICFIGSDLGYGVMKDFSDPDRLFREGVSEQHVIGMASGMALDGKIVYVNTIASFLTRRCYEQIHLDLCLSRAKVRLLASGGGLVYAPLGPTHIAVDDFALLRPLPNMTILAPCDAEEMHHLMPLTVDIDGPVYVRLAKGGDAVVSHAEATYSIGKAVDMTPEMKGNVDITIITTGIMVQQVLAAVPMLQKYGYSIRVLHCHTVKPLDSESIINCSFQSQFVFTAEEHIRIGGLGSGVAELFADNSIKTPLCRLALPDKFFCEHGSQDKILENYGLTTGFIEKIGEKIHGELCRNI